MRQICQASTEEAQGFKQQDKGEDNWDLFVTKWEGGGVGAITSGLSILTTHRKQ